MIPKNRYFSNTCLIFLAVTLLIPVNGAFVYVNAGESNILYIRLDIKTINGREVENNLLMLPAEEEFRIASFDHYNVTGSCPENAKPDQLSAAKHDAFKNVLRSFGVRSIRNKSQSRKSQLHEESVLSYEGFIKTTYEIVSQGFDPENQVFNVKMGIDFAPLAYPSEWRIRYYKKKLYDTLKNMISVFL